MGASPEADSRKRSASDHARKNSPEVPTTPGGARSNLPTSISIMNAAPESSQAGASSSQLGVQSMSEAVQQADSENTYHLETSDNAPVSQGEASRASTRPRTPEKQPSDVRRSPPKPFLPAALLRKLPGSADRSYPPSPGADSVPISTPRSASMRSLQLSEDDDVSADENGSQAITSSGEEEDESPGLRASYTGYDDDAAADAPQFIMPSVQMPSRRPFTERGRHVGKLKIMIAGRKGVGKTSLLKSIVQTCEDIVHVDPFASGPPRFKISKSGDVNLKQTDSDAGRSTSVDHVLASTKAYPTWMADTESSSRILRRSKSSDDTILERNICFIDTPGFDSSTYTQHSAVLIQTLEEQLHRNAALASLSDSELLSIFSGSGGHQTDIILYLVSGETALDSAEVECMRSLSRLTNFVPIISRADSVPSANILERKVDTLQRLEKGNVEVFDINRLSTGRGTASDHQHVLAVSSAPARDDENIDASLLMSSGYIPPLEPSDLQLLVDRLFDPDTAALMRHNALRKFLQWRQQQTFNTPSMSLNSLRGARPAIQAPIFHQSAASSVSATSVIGDSVFPSGVLVNRRSSSGCGAFAERDSNGTSSPSSFNPAYSPDAYTVAQVLDHTQREERLAQVRLARWAADLQRALRNERARFAALKEAERTAWLQDRLEERIDSNVDESEKGAMIRRQSQAASQLQRLQMGSEDPLGLFEWRARLSQRGLLVAKVVGGAGLVGAFVVWIVRTWGWGMALIPEHSALRGNNGLSSLWLAKDW